MPWMWTRLLRITQKWKWGAKAEADLEGTGSTKSDAGVLKTELTKKQANQEAHCTDTEQREHPWAPSPAGQVPQSHLVISYLSFVMQVIQTPCKIFMKFGQFYRRIFRQKGRIGQFIELIPTGKAPRSHDTLRCDLSVYLILVFTPLRIILWSDSRTKLCELDRKS